MRLFFRPRQLTRETIHQHEESRRRARRLGGEHVEDFVFGANDGIITTFAIVAGAVGGALGSVVILILGFANLFADGVSMGASNYLGKRSRQDYYRTQREMEEWEIANVPEEEIEEVREIFRRKGIEGEQLEVVVEAITQNREAWIDVMMADELGLGHDGDSPFVHGLATFLAFLAAGIVPLIPYMFCTSNNCFILSSLATATVLFSTGALRTLITGVSWIRAGFEMLGVGSLAAVVAYAIGRLISAIA